MQVLTVIPERLRTLLTTVIVTAESDLAGFVLRGQPAQECQLHVHRITAVSYTHLTLPTSDLV